MLEKTPLRRRSAYSSVLLCLFLVVVGVVGYLGLEAVARETFHAVTDNRNLASTAAQIRTTSLGLRRLEKETFLNLDDAWKRDQYAAKWTGLRNDLVNELSTMEQTVATSDEKQRLARMRDDLAVYENGYRLVVQEIRNGTLKTPQQCNSKIGEAENSIRDLEDLTEKLNNDYQSQAADDPLVAAVVLGMAAALVISVREKAYFKILPGIILAQSTFIPIGIVLYGKNLEIKALLNSSSWLFLQVIAITFLTFVFMYWLGRLLGFNQQMRYLLGFGSAICGTSAIAISSPVLECEPNDTATGLVDNTIAVFISLYVLSAFVLPHVVPREYAALAGTILHQTGGVKMALASGTKDVLAFGLAVKSLRVAMLVLAIPTVSYLLRKRVYIPWYLVLFLVFGVVFSYASFGAAIAQHVTSLHDICFSTALASIGLNAKVLHVFKKLFKPLLLIMVVFLLDLALWWFTSRAHPLLGDVDRGLEGSSGGHLRQLRRCLSCQCSEPGGNAERGLGGFFHLPLWGFGD